MKQKSLSNWLKFIIIGIGLCGIVVYGIVVPIIGQGILTANPDYERAFYPWLIFIWITAIPCYLALAFSWGIASNIGKDKSFSVKNAVLLKWIAVAAAVDSAFFFIGNIVYLFLNISHPGVTLLSLVVVFVGAAVSVAAAALSHLVLKAVDLQEQNDLTI